MQCERCVHHRAGLGVADEFPCIAFDNEPNSRELIGLVILLARGLARQDRCPAFRPLKHKSPESQQDGPHQSGAESRR